MDEEKEEEVEEEEEDAGEALSITTVVDLWSKQVISCISSAMHTCTRLCVGGGVVILLTLECDH